jgi:hypothetical protein
MRFIKVYEDENFMFYLEKGKHKPGLPKKQIKRIEELASKYRLEANQLIFRKEEDECTSTRSLSSRSYSRKVKAKLLLERDE